MPLIKGEVTEKLEKDGKPYGVVLNGQKYTYSRPEYRNEPWYEPKVGDTVELVMTTPKEGYTTGFIQRIKNATEPIPFNPDGDPGPQPPSDAVRAGGGGVTDRDRSIIRQVAVKAAAELVAHHPAFRELNQADVPGAVSWLAAQFEEDVTR